MCKKTWNRFPTHFKETVSLFFFWKQLMLRCWADELPARWLNSSETISFNLWNSLTCCSIYLLTFLPSLGRATPLSCLYMLSKKARVTWVGCQLVLFGQKKNQWIKNYCINDIHVPTCKIYIQWAELFVRKSAKMERQQSTEKKRLQTRKACVFLHVYNTSLTSHQKMSLWKSPFWRFGSGDKVVSVITLGWFFFLRRQQQPRCTDSLTCVLVGRFLNIPERAVAVTESSVSAPLNLQKAPSDTQLLKFHRLTSWRGGQAGESEVKVMEHTAVLLCINDI